VNTLEPKPYRGSMHWKEGVRKTQEAFKKEHEPTGNYAAMVSLRVLNTWLL
jgi:hypothetical protein